MIEIKEISTAQEIKEFVRFPLKLYKNNKQYVPDLESEVFDLLDARKNPALKFCLCQPFLAYKDGEVVGRILGIINPKANSIWNTSYVRFGFIEFVDDLEVSGALLNAVASWGQKHGMDKIQGPMGFTDYDKEGMLIGDYDKIGSMITFYNYPYYKTHMEKHGYVKDADWIQIQVDVPTELPARFVRIAKLVKERLKLCVHTIPKKNMYGKEGHKVFELLNQAYAPLFGFTPFNDEQIDQFLKQYVPLLNPDLMPVVENEKGELVGVAITLPSLTKALQKSKGRMLPFGWFHLLKSLKWKNEEKLELLLIGVRPDYQGLGVNSLFFEHLWPVATKLGFKYAETGPQLEDNLKELSQWKDFNPQYLKPRRCWKKDL